MASKGLGKGLDSMIPPKELPEHKHRIQQPIKMRINLEK